MWVFVRAAVEIMVKIITVLYLKDMRKFRHDIDLFLFVLGGDAEHQLNLEISENETRKDFSKAERIDYARRLERIESAKARERMEAGVSNPSLNSDKGRTDNIVAKKLGIGGKDTYNKEKYIVDHKDQLSPEDFANWDESKLSTNNLQIRHISELKKS